MSKVFSVYDRKAQAFMTPFYMQNKAMAERAFRNTVNDAEHNFYANPEDFDLYYLGEYEEMTGEFIQEETNELITTAVAVKDEK